MKTKRNYIFLIVLFAVSACEKDEPEKRSLQLTEAFVGDTELNLSGGMAEDLPVDRSITLLFSAALHKASAQEAIALKNEQQLVNTDISFSSGDQIAVIFPAGVLDNNTTYTLAISSQLKGANGEDFPGLEVQFKTRQGTLDIVAVQIAGKDISQPGRIIDVPLDLDMEITFSLPLEKASFQDQVKLNGPEHHTVSVDFSNEGLIVYVLAASSPTYPISKEVYTEGWAKNGQIKNGQSFYGYDLPLGYDYGGPLFFAHYSFLGLDPRNLQDAYADYWQQNEHHARINRAYCMDNPQQYAGYSENNWGLTASDNHLGYAAHSPAHDLGVITPTAALSSFPYTPEASLDALHFFYYTLGDRLWGEYGFYDAFNITEGWYAGSYLAIDQGPIIIMIENYRTALLWELFMSVPEVWQGLEKLGFTSFNKTQ